MTQVAAICVAYRPDLRRLTAVLEAICPQVEQVLVVDNSECEADAETVRGVAAAAGAVHQWLGMNRGLAAAFNRGMETALGHGCSHVLLLDQDSVAGSDMVSRLLDAAQDAIRSGVEVAALGPCYVDERLGPARLVRFGAMFSRRIVAATQGPAFRVDMLISSGSLIPAAALERVGPMDTDLFIDHVDTDWCLRARRLGLELLAVRDATMRHRLGERSARFMRRTLPLHSPARLYYVFRNSLWLYRRAYAPGVWMRSDIRRLAVVLALHVLHGEDLRATLSAVGRGVAAGLQPLPAK